MDNIYMCPYCNKKYNSKNAWCSHKGKCKLNSNYAEKLKKPKKPRSDKGKPLSEEHKDKIKKGVQRAISEGKKYDGSFWRGKKHTEEEKKKISEGMKKAIKEGRATGWHKRKAGSQSYPEKWMSIVIKNEFNDKNYQDELHVGKYRLDFAWPHKMRYIEIDGRQHEDIERKESDIKKDAFCKSLGWTGMRVSWSYICQNTQKAILEMKDFIDNGTLSLIAWENPKEKLRKDIAARKVQHQKDNDERKNLILNSGIDFQSFGWLEKVANLLGISHIQAKRWILRNMPGFYERSKHR